jgi:hypothetical protein
MPWSLIVAWLLLSVYVTQQQRHASHFEGTSKVHFYLLNSSFALGFASSIGLLIYYFTKVSWYWPIILYLIDALLGAALLFFIRRRIGSTALSTFAFVGWPACAAWVFLIVRGLAP